MPVAFENFLYSFKRNGKPVYAPNPFCEALGHDIRTQVKKAFKFDNFIYHFKDGSHVVALHKHRANRFFCRVDIARFFYSVQRNRLKRVLKDIGIFRAEYYAKWSTVKNPYEGGGYVIPYGFVQSPILATLVLARSAIGIYLRGLDPLITVSVYMDDICLSGNDEPALRDAFEGLLAAVDEAGFTLNDEKTRTTAEQIDIFNCNLEHDATSVMQERVDEFYAVERTPDGENSFEIYCDIVQSKTWRIGAKKRKRKLFFRSKAKTLKAVTT